MGLANFGSAASKQVGRIWQGTKDVVTRSRGFVTKHGKALGTKIRTNPKTAAGIAAGTLTAMGGAAYAIRRRGKNKSRKSK